MKIILDSNMLISASLSQGNCFKVLHETILHHDLYCSEEIFQEYVSVIQRKKFQKNFPKLKDLIILIADHLNFVRPQTCKFKTLDPKDQIFLDTAIACHADLIITGNLKHFREININNLKILNPQQSINLLLPS